jgi:hypothetical protein
MHDIGARFAMLGAFRNCKLWPAGPSEACKSKRNFLPGMKKRTEQLVRSVRDAPEELKSRRGSCRMRPGRRNICCL